MAGSKRAQAPVFGVFESWVLAEDGYGGLTSRLQQVGIERGVGNLQIKSHAALLCAIYIARTS